MAFSRFTLDTSQLDDSTVGLDGPNFPLNGTAAASLGSATATAFAAVVKVASADAPLGEVLAEVSQVTVTVAADADAPLGGIVASATGGITTPASAEASLGGLVASASADLTVSGSAVASLGGVTASAVGVVRIVASASAGLGGVSAAADGVVTPIGTMTANLGGLDASAVGTVVPQPTPTPAGGAGGRPSPYRQPRRKKVEPVVEVVPEVVVLNPKTVQAYCAPIVASVKATAEGSVTFIAEDDDLQVLLML